MPHPRKRIPGTDRYRQQKPSLRDERPQRQNKAHACSDKVQPPTNSVRMLRKIERIKLRKRSNSLLTAHTNHRPAARKLQHRKHSRIRKCNLAQGE